MSKLSIYKNILENAFNQLRNSKYFLARNLNTQGDKRTDQSFLTKYYLFTKQWKKSTGSFATSWSSKIGINSSGSTKLDNIVSVLDNISVEG